MKFTIIIPTMNNFKYFNLTLKSILKNSCTKHQIIVYINGEDHETKNLLVKKKIKFIYSKKNIGLCSAVNRAAKLSINNYICYAHDDMYFLPGWDKEIIREIKALNHNKFYFSATSIGYKKKNKNDINNYISFNAGINVNKFNEKKILSNYKKLKFYNLQGSHWAPHVIHKSIWQKVGGFSEEFDPGYDSDPDLNMKLWSLAGVRIFKGVNKSRVYHFGSLTTRKRNVVKKNNGKKIFLLKWGFTIEHFIKFYLKRGEHYDGPLSLKKDIKYYLSLLNSKMKLYLLYLIKT